MAQAALIGIEALTAPGLRVAEHAILHGPCGLGMDQGRDQRDDKSNAHCPTYHPKRCPELPDLWPRRHDPSRLQKPSRRIHRLVSLIGAERLRDHHLPGPPPPPP